MTLIDTLPIVAAAISYFFVRKQGDPLNFFNPFIYFYWTYFLFCFVGIFYKDIYTYALDISDKTILLISLGLIIFSIGGALANYSRSEIEIKKTIQHLILDAINKIPTNGTFIAILIAIPVSVAVLFMVKTEVILWLTDSFDDERINFRQGSGWITILGISSAYIGTIYSSIHFYKKKKYLKLFITTATFAICAISYGNRAPGLEIIIIGGIFIWVGIFKKIRMLHFLLGFFILLAFVMALGVVRQGLEFNLESIVKQMLWRPFANIQNIEWVLLFIPSIHDYFYGESMLIDLSVLLPGYQPNFGTYMKLVMGKEFSGGSITLTFLGQAYSDFGVILSLILILAAGFFFQRVFIVLSKNGKFLPLLIISSITAKAMVSSGIISPIIYIFIPCTILMIALIPLKLIKT